MVVALLDRVTVGMIANALFAPSDPLAPGVARVSVATLPATSLIVPLFKANELVAI